MARESLLLGYGVVDKNVETFSGGIMVTDSTGLPLEFRYTEPLTPTRIQKVLYGEVLETYIKGEVIIRSLLESLDSAPEIVIVNEESLLDMPRMSIPVVSISETRLKPLNSPSSTQKIGPREFLLQVNDTGSPVRVKLVDEDKELAERINSILVNAGEAMDVTEPLVRVHQALDILCSKELEK